MLEQRPVFRELPRADLVSQASAFAMIGSDARFALRALQGLALARMDAGGVDDAISAVGLCARIAWQQGSARSWANLAFVPQAGHATIRLSTMLVDQGALSAEQALHLKASIAPLLKPDATWQLDQNVDRVQYQLGVARELVTLESGAQEASEGWLDTRSLAASAVLKNEATWKAASQLVRETKGALARARESGEVVAVAEQLLAKIRAMGPSDKWAEILLDALTTGLRDAAALHGSAIELDALLTTLADPEVNAAARRREANALYQYRAAARLVRTAGSGDASDRRLVWEACVAATAVPRFEFAAARCDTCFAMFLHPDLVDRSTVAEWLIASFTEPGPAAAPDTLDQRAEAVHHIIGQCRDEGSLPAELVTARLIALARAAGLEFEPQPGETFAVSAQGRKRAMECLSAFVDSAEDSRKGDPWIASLPDAKCVYIGLVADAWFATKHSRRPSWDEPEAAAIRAALSLDAISDSVHQLAVTAQTDEGKVAAMAQVEVADISGWWTSVQRAFCPSSGSAPADSQAPTPSP